MFAIALLITIAFTAERSHLFSKAARSILSTIFLLTVLAGHLYEFANGLYGRIPSFLGGGESQPVSLILKDENAVREKVQRIGVAFDPNMLTSNTFLLLETDESYVMLFSVVDENERVKWRTVKIARDTVSAVLYGKER